MTRIWIKPLVLSFMFSTFTGLFSYLVCNWLQLEIKWQSILLSYFVLFISTVILLQLVSFFSNRNFDHTGMTYAVGGMAKMLLCAAYCLWIVMGPVQEKNQIIYVFLIAYFFHLVWELIYVFKILKSKALKSIPQ